MNRKKRAVLIAMCLVFTVFLVEIFGGLYSKSLALLSDAGHMFVDCTALAIAYYAIVVGEKGPSNEYTFGHRNIEATAGIVSGTILASFIIFVVFRDAIYRFIHGGAVIQVEIMLGIAVVGLVANMASAFILKEHSEKDLAVRGAFLQNLSDLLLSVVVIVGATLIMITGNSIWDPVLSIFMGIYLFVFPLRKLYQEAVRILHAGVPDGVDLEMVKNSILSIPDVEEIPDIHIIAMGNQLVVAGAHIRISDGLGHSRKRKIREAVRRSLEKIAAHPTIELEDSRSFCGPANHCR